MEEDQKDIGKKINKDENPRSIEGQLGPVLSLTVELEINETKSDKSSNDGVRVGGKINNKVVNLARRRNEKNGNGKEPMQRKASKRSANGFKRGKELGVRGGDGVWQTPYSSIHGHK